MGSTSKLKCKILSPVLKTLLIILSLFATKSYGQIAVITDSTEIKDLPEYLENKTYKFEIKVDSLVFNSKTDEYNKIKYVVKVYKKQLCKKLHIKKKYFKNIQITKIANYYIISNKIKGKVKKNYYMLFFNFETLTFTNFVLGK